MENNFDENSIEFHLLRVRLLLIDILRKQIDSKKMKLSENQHLIGVIPNMFGENLFNILKDMVTFKDVSYVNKYENMSDFIKEKINIDSKFIFCLDDVDFYLDLDTSKNPSITEIKTFDPYKFTNKDKYDEIVHIRFFAINIKGE